MRRCPRWWRPPSECVRRARRSLPAATPRRPLPTPRSCSPCRSHPRRCSRRCSRSCQASCSPPRSPGRRASTPIARPGSPRSRLPGDATPQGAFFALDVGGSSVKSALVVGAKPEGIAREPVARDLDGLVRQIVRLCEEAHAPAWGLSIAGLIDEQRGVVRYASNLGLHDAPIVELLKAELPAPLIFVNDLVAA